MSHFLRRDIRFVFIFQSPRSVYAKSRRMALSYRQPLPLSTIIQQTDLPERQRNVAFIETGVQSSEEEKNK
jgi:hypothetical protein